MSGKVLQQELFTKKLWFRALKKRGEQREELGEIERKQEEQALAGPTVEASTKFSANVLADRLCFPAPTAPAPRASSKSWDPIVSSFSVNGVCLLKRNSSSGSGDDGLSEMLKEASQAVRRCLEELRAAATAAGVGSEDSRLKSKELVRRSPGRYDLVVDLTEGDVQSPSIPRSIGTVFRDLRGNAPWEPLMRRLLGASCYLMHCGCVISLPGASTQAIHRDGKHLYLETEALRPSEREGEQRLERHAGSESSLQYPRLPAHCITVFVPLVDLKGENGPTEFWPGTHHTLTDAPTEDATSVTFSDQDASSEDLSTLGRTNELHSKSEIETSNLNDKTEEISILLDVDDDDDDEEEEEEEDSCNDKSDSDRGADADSVDKLDDHGKKNDSRGITLTHNVSPNLAPRLSKSESSGSDIEAWARAGDAIIFDYRILHRGLANNSTNDRPLAYFTYGRSWFRDATNYSTTSLVL